MEAETEAAVGDDGGSASISRDEAIKIQQTKIDSLKLDIRENKLNIEKLEKKSKKRGNIQQAGRNGCKSRRSGDWRI